VDFIPVSPPCAALRQVAGTLEIADDLRRRALGDPDGARDVSQTGAGMSRDVLERVGVVCEESERMSDSGT